MTVWATANFQRDENPTDYYAGTFTAKGGSGLIIAPHPSPILASYNVTTYGGSAGGTIAGQGGGVAVF